MKLLVHALFLRQQRVHRCLGRYFCNTSYDLGIAELNKEMESIFGKPPPSSITSPSTQEPKPNQEMESIFCEPPSCSFTSSSTQELEPNQEMESVFGPNPNKPAEARLGLTHVNSSGRAQMVDVCSKSDSKRVAVASCRVLLGREAFDLVASNQVLKGDVLTVAKIAGINGAKQTSSLIPLCHNIGLDNVRVDLALNEADLSVEIEGEATTTAKTGVEMEAMTAVAVAGLTVYDMCKAASKDVRITDVRLESKTGGKSGSWFRKQ